MTPFFFGSPNSEASLVRASPRGQYMRTQSNSDQTHSIHILDHELLPQMSSKRSSQGAVEAVMSRQDKKEKKNGAVLEIPTTKNNNFV
jgi:hypothetical protein